MRRIEEMLSHERAKRELLERRVDDLLGREPGQSGAEQGELQPGLYETSRESGSALDSVSR